MERQRIEEGMTPPPSCPARDAKVPSYIVRSDETISQQGRAMNDRPRMPLHSEDDGADDDLTISALEPEDSLEARSVLVAALANGMRQLRGLWQASGVIALVILMSMLAVIIGPHLPRLPETYPRPVYLRLGVGEPVARCLSGFAWSRDGRLISAVRSPACSTPYLGGVVQQPNLYVFNASTGKLLSTLTLDSDVNATLARNGLSTADAATYSISYYETDWSADGQSLAVPFFIYGDLAAYNGVVMVGMHGGAPSAIASTMLAPISETATSSAGDRPSTTDRWDVPNATKSSVYVPPALGYHWLPTDELAADEPLSLNGATPPAGPLTAPGNPIGSQSFSMWRVGSVSLINSTLCGDITKRPNTAPYASLSLEATVWSPDGRYLLVTSVQARLPASAPASATPTPTPETGAPCNKGPSPELVPAAPIHDAGLKSALKLLTLDPNGNNYLTLAWSPDGQRLAVGAASFSHTGGSVVIYECSTGATLRTITGGQFAEDGIGTVFDVPENPVWSPDGSRLLLTINGPSAQVVIIQPQTLSQLAGL